MRLKATSIVLTVIVATAFGACKGKKETTELQKKANELFGTLPEKMPGSENDTEARLALGKKLYFDNRLSANDSQSCNTCHRLDENLGGVDNEPTSTGAHGKRGGRNSPTVLNAGFHIAQFWDGRAEDLQAQAKGPILNPVEMAMTGETEVLEKVKKLEDYNGKFKEAFPDAKEPLTYDNLAEAIAAFERTLITNDRFDDYLNGDDSALTEQEKKGLQTFIDTGCVSCHSGALLGANSYRKMGQVNPYSNKKDMGRFEVTGKEEDKYVFKVPSLRNIALTHPYFHDGAVATLPEAVRMMGKLQLGVDLSDEKVNDMVAFLNALSDKEREKAYADKK